MWFRYFEIHEGSVLIEVIAPLELEGCQRNVVRERGAAECGSSALGKRRAGEGSRRKSATRLGFHITSQLQRSARYFTAPETMLCTAK